MRVKHLPLCLLLMMSPLSQAQQDLPRRASWQAKFTPAEPAGRRIDQLAPGSKLIAAGLQAGDVILAVNGVSISSSAAWSDITDALVAGQPQQLLFKRGEQTQNVVVTFDPVPKESYPDLAVTYASVTSDFGLRQRTIITRPKNKSGRLAAIMFVQGLSCSSIELVPWAKSNYARLIKDIIRKSDMVVMRVEKPGKGDSQGSCAQTDFLTELNGYEAAIAQLKSLPYVDPARILVYGSSMGSALAPYLARKHQLNAVISDGTFFRSWFEHMLEIERRIKTMQGLDQTEVNKQITQAYIPLYYGMLVEKQSYQDLIARNPLLASYNYHGLNHMYGRPMAYYHQVQDFNFAGAWEKITVPVRIRWGTHDWIMSEADNDMIIEVLEQTGHENVTLYKYPGLDHWETIHTSAKNSYTGQPGKWEDNISQQIIDWAKALNKRAWRK